MDFLTFNDQMDTSAQKTYVKLAERYGWDLSRKEDFGRQKLLFANAVTPEGYSVWFVCHSNYTEDDTEKWSNIFEGDFIFEEWLPRSHGIARAPFTRDVVPRVIFAKKKICGNNYCFMGVYKLKEITRNEKGNAVRVFKRISEEYPFESAVVKPSLGRVVDIPKIKETKSGSSAPVAMVAKENQTTKNALKGHYADGSEKLTGKRVMVFLTDNGKPSLGEVTEETSNVIKVFFFDSGKETTYTRSVVIDKRKMYVLDAE